MRILAGDPSKKGHAVAAVAPGMRLPVLLICFRFCFAQLLPELMGVGMCKCFKRDLWAAVSFGASLCQKKVSLQSCFLAGD